MTINRLPSPFPVCALLMAAALPGRAQSDPVPDRQDAGLQPPLGSTWGQPAPKLLEFASSLHLDANLFIPANNSRLRVITLTPTAQTPASHNCPKAQFRFIDNQLVEVTLWHATPSMSAADVQDLCRKVRRQLSSRFFTPWRPNKHSSSDASGFRVDSSSWHMEPVPGVMINVALTEVINPANQSRKADFTLTFSNQNLSAKLQ